METVIWGTDMVCMYSFDHCRTGDGLEIICTVHLVYMYVLCLINSLADSLQRGYAELMRQASQERIQVLQAEQDLYKGVTGQSSNKLVWYHTCQYVCVSMYLRGL